MSTIPNSAEGGAQGSGFPLDDLEVRVTLKIPRHDLEDPVAGWSIRPSDIERLTPDWTPKERARFLEKLEPHLQDYIDEQARLYIAAELLYTRRAHP
jgi:hypothetical protein